MIENSMVGTLSKSEFPAIKQLLTLPGGSVVESPPANAKDTGDRGSIPELGRSPG